MSAATWKGSSNFTYQCPPVSAAAQQPNADHRYHTTRLCRPRARPGASGLNSASRTVLSQKELPPFLTNPDYNRHGSSFFKASDVSKRPLHAGRHLTDFKRVFGPNTPSSASLHTCKVENCGSSATAEVSGRPRNTPLAAQHITLLKGVNTGFPRNCLIPFTASGDSDYLWQLKPLAARNGSRCQGIYNQPTDSYRRRPEHPLGLSGQAEGELCELCPPKDSGAILVGETVYPEPSLLLHGCFVWCRSFRSL